MADFLATVLSAALAAVVAVAVIAGLGLIILFVMAHL